MGAYYSPASKRVQWLLDRRGTGKDWARRNAEYEDDAIGERMMAGLRVEP
jgi:hypothetical protein